MPLPYPTKVVLPFDIATAQDMNERHANDVALANGSGLDDDSVTATKILFSGFIETVAHSVSGVSIPAGLWYNTGFAVPSKYMDGTWTAIPDVALGTAGLYVSLIGPTGLVYINSTRTSATTYSGTIRIIFIKHSVL